MFSASKNRNGCFDCDACPQNGDRTKGRFCVAWWETVHENVQTGETRVIKGCAWEQLPIYLIEVIKASNRPAAAVESTRNEIAKGLENIFQAVNGMAPSITQLTYRNRENQD